MSDRAGPFIVYCLFLLGAIVFGYMGLGDEARMALLWAIAIACGFQAFAKK